MKDDGVSPLSTGLLLPDAVKRVCDEGVGLRWDHEASCYEVKTRFKKPRFFFHAVCLSEVYSWRPFSGGGWRDVREEV